MGFAYARKDNSRIVILEQIIARLHGYLLKSV